MTSPGPEEKITVHSGSQPLGKHLGRKEHGSPGEHQTDHEPDKSLWWKRPTASWAALGRADSWGKWSFPSAQHWWDTSGVLGPALFSPLQRRHELTGLSSEGPLRWLRKWSFCYLGRGWESCSSAAWRRECSEKSYPMMYKYLMRYLFCRRQS